MGVLTNYVTEKIKELRYVSVDDDGVTKEKLILQPRDTSHIEIELGLGGGEVDTTPFARKADFGILYRVPSVRNFGAIGDGVANDTEAVQAAIDANREVVFTEPPVSYKCGQLTVPAGRRFIGEGRTDLPGAPGTLIDSTVVGLTATPSAIRIVAGSAGVDSGIRIENLWIKGHAAESPDYTASAFPSWGIRGNTQIQSLRLEHSVISGFNINVQLDDCRHSVLEHTVLRNAVNCNLKIFGMADHVTVRDCEFVVVNEAGTAHADAIITNVWIAKRNDSQYPRHVSLIDLLIDEVARNGQTTPPTTLLIDRADDFVLDRAQMYYPVGATGGNGRGIDMVAGNRPTFKNIVMLPYIVDASHVPLNTIRLGAGVSRARLDQIKTDPNLANGGGDILDSSVAPTWTAVNGKNVVPSVDGTKKFEWNIGNDGVLTTVEV